MINTITLTGIPLSDPDLPNSGRGPVDGIGLTPSPAGWPYRDIYRRDALRWSSIHTAPGSFNWAPFDEALAEAETLGGRMGFRIMPWLNGDTTRHAPAWVPDQSGSTAPDWNSSAYLSAWEELWAALGARYAGNPRIFYIDLPALGDCGEGGVFGPTAPTRASADRAIRAVLNAFPTEFKTANWYASPYSGLGWPEVVMENAVALGQARKVGIRNDFIGGQVAQYSAQMTEVADAWKYAPMVGEFAFTATMSNADQNQTEFHLSSNTAGNLGVGGSTFTYSGLSSADKTSYEAFMKRLGFRYSLTQVRIDTTPGAAMFVAPTFRNDGIAPVCDPWSIHLTLTNAAGTIVFDTPMTGDIRTLLGSGSSAEFASTVTLPAELAGNYTAGIRITDPEGYMQPMRLATVGRTSTGIYPVASVTVQPSARYVRRRRVREQAA